MGSLVQQYVCAYVPELAAQARIRLRPELAENPVVILAGKPPLQMAVSMSHKARRMGIAVGMTPTELEAFTELTILRRSAAEEKSATSAILETAGSFTPRIQVWPSQNSFVFVLDMTGTTLIFGDSTKSAMSISEAIKSLGLHVRIAVSQNIHTAVCAAPYAHRVPHVIPAGQERDTLARLPLSSLPLTIEQADALNMWGLHTVGEFASLPQHDLVARMGQAGYRLQLMARGEHPHTFVPEEPLFLLKENIEFDYAEESLDSLLFVIGPLLDQLIARASARALALASVTIRLTLEGGIEHCRTVKPAIPLIDRSSLLKLLHLDLQAHAPSASVVGMCIHAQAGKRGAAQEGLFSPQLPEPTRLDLTLAQIEALVGEGAVGSPRLSDTHHADSFVMDRFIACAKQSNADPNALSTMLRRIRPPAVLRIRLDEEGRPSWFAWRGQRYTITDAFGPWRCSGEWWSQQVWAREEWDVRAIAGDHALVCVLLHDLLHKQWMLDAFYD
ncbi:DNA polymerase Y family protein [Terriglobus roseus]|uniref:Protein ImuB n=1 Tax=Terriglobus roseus TaxID=392734 RepID=A0A1G7NRQ4_9BACT|nr:DNA polymerase Y family protein [Terriglobus roseus]SDF76682.1 protein ImuB [Terriglobus roseus]